MKTRKDTATSADGLTVEIDVLLCDSCNCETFNLFVIPPHHNHLQCTLCGKSFCDGTCGDADYRAPQLEDGNSII